MEEQQEQARVPEQPVSKRSSETFDWFQSIVTALVALILIFTFFARTMVVEGSSMVPTLENGDRLIISKLFFRPEYGDIVVLRKPDFKEEPIIKRVIAVGGQTVDIDFDRHVVYVDGAALDEPYINEPTAERENFAGPVTVPEGCVFVMGDNRNRSTDSRYAAIGCVDTRQIIGRALLRITPLNKFGRLS